MKHRIYLILLLYAFAPLMSATLAQTNSHVTMPDTLVMQCDTTEGAVYPYRVRPKETLYSISKAFETDIFRLNELNPWLNDRILGIGDTVLIPLRNKIVIPGNVPSSAIPVTYEVRPKDNVFRICRICAGIHERKILDLNEKDDPSLQPGEHLLIGYFIPGTRDSTRELEITKDLDRREQQSYEGKYSREQTELQMVRERGVAVWNRSNKGRSNYYVLHKSAPINSIMEIANPMNRRTVYAKVVGQLPDNTYPPEVIAVVSPAVANYLGVLDPRFYVRLRYREQIAEVSRR